MPRTCGGWQEVGPRAADSHSPPPHQTPEQPPLGCNSLEGTTKVAVNFHLRKEVLPQTGTLSIEVEVTKDSLSHPRRTQVRGLPEGIGVPNRQAVGAATS